MGVELPVSAPILTTDESTAHVRLSAWDLLKGESMSPVGGYVGVTPRAGITNPSGHGDDGRSSGSFSINREELRRGVRVALPRVLNWCMKGEVAVQDF